MLHTKKICRVLAIAEPSSGLATGIINAIMGEIGLENWELQVVIVPNVSYGVSEHVDGRNHSRNCSSKATEEDE